MTPTSIAAYLAFFAGAGFLFLFGNLLIGWLFRPRAPNKEKLEIYECGEPTIGSSFVQFDLRFYVVALLFIIFDVEVALFFPWATVFGKANQLRDSDLPRVEASVAPIRLSAQAEGLYRELGVPSPTLDGVAGPPPAGRLRSEAEGVAAIEGGARALALLSLLDILVFFAVLMVGFFYVWRRGDLDWVRALSRQRAVIVPRAPPGAAAEEQPALVA